MTPEEAALRRSIEQLYDAFSVYPLAEAVEGCPCCTTEEDRCSIHSKPLRELTGKDLDRFVMKAMTTWGDQTDFKHFLPRLFEVLAFEWETLTLPEALVGRLMYTGWKGQQYLPWVHWPVPERMAVDTYFRALWAWALVKTDYPLAEDWLETLAHAYDDLTSFLQYWWNQEECEAAIVQLAHFLFWRDAELQHGRLEGVYWDQYPNAMKQVVAWAHHPRTLEMVKRGLPKVRHMAWLVETGISQDWIDWVLA